MKLPPYQNFPELSDDKVLLRQILSSDIPGIVEISFYDGKAAITVEAAIEMQNRISNDYHKGTSIHWGIADIKTNNIIGTCGYYRGFSNETGELGCVLLATHRGQGFMTNALQQAIDFGMNIIGLGRIIAITTSQNQKAKQLVERLGFVRVSDLRDNKVEYEFRR